MKTIKLEDFDAWEARCLRIIINRTGGDSNRVLDALHQLAAKLGRAADVSPDRLAAGQAHHAAALVGTRN